MNSSNHIKSGQIQTKIDIDNSVSFDDYCKGIGVDVYSPGWPDKFGSSMKKFIGENNEKKIRVLSLFSGAGGLDIGFHDIGFDIVESVEIEEKFCNTLVENSKPGKIFENSKNNCIDIRQYNPSNIGKIDFIIGGPPCQTFSAAGRRANGVLGTTDSRGLLFKEYVRILKVLMPAGFLFENVYGIIGAQNGEPWKEIISEFSKIGYKLFYRVLDAADYGVPQHRERLIIVGLKDGSFSFPRPTHGPDSIDNHCFYTASEAISDLTKINDVKPIPGRYQGLLEGIPPGLNYSFYTEEMGHPTPIFAWRSKFSDFLYKADPDEPVRTIKAQGGQWTGPLHWDNRHFTIEELKRLQTFPDNYFISGENGTIIHQIGNSVPPQMARILAIAIANQIFDIKTPSILPTLSPSEELGFRKRKRLLTEQYREKAKMAISSISKEKITIEYSTEYYVSINDNFFQSISIEPKDNYYRAEIVWSEDLLINLFDHSNNDNCEFTIIIEPISEWAMEIKKIVVKSYSSSPKSFTLCWKVVERELKLNKIKEDLVQLSGYYQYKPKIKCTLLSEDRKAITKILKNIVSGKCVSQIISTSDLSKIWNVSGDNVLKYAEKMKKIGYEIRNNNTNPQIPEGYWLIPYCFPTLTNLSIQLNKQLK